MGTNVIQSITLPATVFLVFLFGSVVSLPALKPTNGGELSNYKKEVEGLGSLAQLNKNLLERSGRSVSSHECLSHIYVMAFTSHEASSQTGEVHAIEIEARGQTRCTRFPVKDNDYTLAKGDLWKLPLDSFYFSLPTPSDRNSSCIILPDIERITIVERSLDGWQIDSIATFFKDIQGGTHAASVDLDANKWIDGDGHPSRRRFDLTLII